MRGSVKHYIVYGGFAPVMRVLTGLNDRAALTALEMMGLDALVRESVEVVDVYGEWGLVVVKMEEKEYRRLLSMGIRAEPEREYRLVGAGAGLSWNLSLVGWSRDLPYTGKGVTIAVVDSGVDPGACGLEGKVVYAKSFVDGEGPEDLYGHGTAVAYVAAGADDKYGGVAQDAKVVNLKVFSRDESTDPIILRALYEALNLDVAVVNMSFGGPGGPDAPLSRAANMLMARGKLPVAAAGNEGPGRGTVGAPAAGELVVAVGAVNKQKKITYYSSRGPADGLMKPDLVAPGGDEGGLVVSARPRGVPPIGPPVDDCYTGLMGTSLAAPHVSGAAALLYEAAKSATVARDVILNTAEDLGEPKEAQGRGLLRIDRALGRIRETNQWTEAATPLLGLIGLAAVPLIGILSAAAREAKIERLRTLYRTGQITYIQLYTLYQRGEITLEELNKILR
jgi:subtilisin family serine protease